MPRKNSRPAAQKRKARLAAKMKADKHSRTGRRRNTSAPMNETIPPRVRPELTASVLTCVFD